MAQADIVKLPYSMVNGKLVVSATVDGVKGRFIFDTGAPFYVSASWAKKNGAKPHGTQGIIDSGGHELNVSKVTVESVILGEGPTMTLDSVQANVFPEGSIVEKFGVDGIIGSDFFADKVVRFDSRDSVILIGSDIAEFKVNPRARVRMDNSNGQNIPFISVTLGRGVPDDPMFDSGDATFFSLSEAAADQGVLPGKAGYVTARGYGSTGMGLGGQAEETDLERIVLPDLRLGLGKFRNVVTTTIPGNGSRFGSAILKYGVVTLDNINHTFFFEPFADKPVDMYQKEWNIGVTLDKDGYLVISAVWKDYWISDGLSIGDRIVEVDGKPVSKIDFTQALHGKLLKVEKDAVPMKVMKADGTIVKSVLYRK